VHITGLQAGTNTNLTPLQFTILSEKLAAAKYESHFIGKGHLGWHTDDHLLVNRGFHSHIGYLGGSQSYRWGCQSKTCDSPEISAGVHDMWHNETPGFDIVGDIAYSTDFYTHYAIQRIRQRDTSKPFWLHVAYQAMHGGAHRSEPPAWELLPNGTGFRNDGYGNALRALDTGIANITAGERVPN
jgi:arylsulfatase A-like enzyme